MSGTGTTGRARLGRAGLVAGLIAAAAVLVPAGTASAATVLKTHPHEGTAGAIPTAAAEGYSSRTGSKVTYTATPAAAVGAVSIRFAGTAATYFDDTGLSTGTGTLLWSAPVLLPSLPPSGTYDKFLAARRGTAMLAGLEIAPNGRLRIKNGSDALKATSTSALAPGTWYHIDALFGSGSVTVRISDQATGTLRETVGPTAVTAGTPTILRTGLRSISGPVLIDQVQVADDWLDAAPPPPPPPPPPPSGSPCGALAAGYDPANPPAYTHVVVLMEENLSYSNFLTSTQVPYLTQLNAQCGAETNFHNATHPSQPNYMAATSGVASGVGVRVSNDNIFEQVQAAGGTWKTYAESMPGPCSLSTVGTYKPGHNPAVFYDDLRTPTNTCAANDVVSDPALWNDIANDTLPTYSWITPNLCHDFYWVSGCSTPQSALWTQGDQYLANLVPLLTAMPSYQAGQTLILITFDEGFGGGDVNGVDCTDPAYYAAHADCDIPTVVISPYIVPGTQDATDLNLYSLLGTTEDILGLPRLGRAVGQASMRPGLGF